MNTGDLVTTAAVLTATRMGNVPDGHSICSDTLVVPLETHINDNIKHARNISKFAILFFF
jgi:hypothetical protein